MPFLDLPFPCLVTIIEFLAGPEEQNPTIRFKNLTVLNSVRSRIVHLGPFSSTVYGPPRGDLEWNDLSTRALTLTCRKLYDIYNSRRRYRSLLSRYYPEVYSRLVSEALSQEGTADKDLELLYLPWRTEWANANRVFFRQGTSLTQKRTIDPETEPDTAASSEGIFTRKLKSLAARALNWVDGRVAPVSEHDSRNDSDDQCHPDAVGKLTLLVYCPHLPVTVRESVASASEVVDMFLTHLALASDCALNRPIEPIWHEQPNKENRLIQNRLPASLGLGYLSTTTVNAVFEMNDAKSHAVQQKDKLDISAIAVYHSYPGAPASASAPLDYSIHLLRSKSKVVTIVPLALDYLSLAGPLTLSRQWLDDLIALSSDSRVVGILIAVPLIGMEEESEANSLVQLPNAIATLEAQLLEAFKVADNGLKFHLCVTCYAPWCRASVVEVARQAASFCE